MNITSINDDYMELIKIFVKNWCRKYCINYGLCLGKEEELLDATEIKTIFGTRIVDGKREYIERAAEVLGTTTEAIIELDSDKLNAYYDAYAYFRLYPEAAKAYNEEFEKHVEKYQTNVQDITQKILAYTKQHDAYIPGIYHKDATITKLCVESHIVTSFNDAKALWKSYIEMVEKVQGLFYNALFGKKLTNKEIGEYNLLVSVLNVTECIIPSKTLHYSLLQKLIKIYQEEGYKDFYSFARINLGLFSESAIHPWCFKETAADKDIIQKYVNIHPIIDGVFTKEYLRKYAMKVKHLCCSFEWSDATYMETEDDDFDNSAKIKESTEIYLPKEESCVEGYTKECNQLCKLAAPVKTGGIIMPERELPYQHYFCMNTELWRKRYDARTRGAE